MTERRQANRFDRWYSLGGCRFVRRLAWIRSSRPKSVVAQRRWGLVSQGLEDVYSLSSFFERKNGTWRQQFLFWSFFVFLFLWYYLFVWLKGFFFFFFGPFKTWDGKWGIGSFSSEAEPGNHIHFFPYLSFWFITLWFISGSFFTIMGGWLTCKYWELIL